jgi:tetratricopeptide (TPR) repeat protein
MAAIPEHELLRPIASGAYGQVWLARNRLGAYRAVKVVYRASFDHERPFEREFAGIKAFEPISRSHEGLVDLLQVGRDDAAGYFYYIMELADDLRAAQPATPTGGSESKASTRAEIPDKAGASGKTLAINPSAALSQPSTHPRSTLHDPNDYVPRTLASELKSRGRLPLEQCIQIGLKLTEALAHLHKQGLVHRDVKPSNIIFVGGVPKLADVGLVTAVDEARSFVGTEGFIPPEGPGTPQADLYSLGIVLYVLSTGKSHQDFPEPAADLQAQANHQQWLEFDAVVHKACQANVRERFRSAEVMHEELALLEGGQSVRHRRTVQRRWVAGKRLAIGACAVAMGILTLLFLQPAKPGHTPNAETLSLYKLGKWYYNQCTTSDRVKSFKYLTKAIEADPKFPQPYGELILLYGWSSVPGVTTDEQRLAAIREMVKKLDAIDPNLAQTHVALSFGFFLERDWQGAEREIAAAIKADPDLAVAHFIRCYYFSLECKTAEAEIEGQRAVALEPPEAIRVSAIAAAWPFMAERRYDRAISQLQQVLELDRNFAAGHDYLGDCYEAQSNYLAAIEHYRTSAVFSGQDPATVNGIFDSLRRAYEAEGQAGYMRKWIELIRANEALPEDKQSDLLGDRDIACYYARLGDKETALDELEKHFDEPNTWSQIKFLPDYDSLHDEPRYKALVKRAGLQP